MRDRSQALRIALAEGWVHWRWGRRCGYPRCCIAMYCWDSLWSLPPSLTRAVSQGVDTSGSEIEWVPCGVFHHGGSSLRLTERIGRLARYWWWSLLTVRRGRLVAQGRLRAPWQAREEPRQGATAPGPVEDAWAEIDAQTQDPELEWI